MAALTDLSDRIAAMTGGNTQTIVWTKADQSLSVNAGVAHSLWTIAGQPGGVGTPGTVTACDRTTSGALPFTNPGGGRQKWLVHASLGAQRSGQLIIYDRLLHIGGFSGTSVSAQNVGGSITRYTDGVGNLAYFEVYTAIGATVVTATLSYTNDLGNPATSTIRVGNLFPRQRSQIASFPLNAGEKGVAAVTSVTLSGTTGTAGNFGITIGHPLMDVVGNSGTSANYGVGATSSVNLMSGDPEVLTDACLALIHQSSSGATQFKMMGMLGMVEK